MNVKRVVVVILIVAISLAAVGAVGAQGQGDPGRGNGRGGRAEIVETLLTVTAEQTGLTREAIVEAWMGGTTLAETITTQSADVQAVIDASITQITATIDERVASGAMTQQRADRLLANLDEVVTNAVNGEFRGRGPGNGSDDRGPGRGMRFGVLQLAAEQTGLTTQELRAQLEAGQSLSDILSANGVDPAAFTTEATTQVQTRLDQAVANGRITQEEADSWLSTFQERLTERLNGTELTVPST
jgi:polyhydroxyalkanoate synthesis regulator phasin